MVHCKKCDQVRYFKTISELRKHQWRKHKELYTRMGEVREAKKQKKELVPIVHVLQPTNPNGEMTVSTLLGKLKEQRDFMVNVVSMIENMVKG